jgi:hypothetical protein
MALGAGIAALVAIGSQLLSRRDPDSYELSYYNPRPPMPDERGYDLREGDPGVGYTVYDNAYLLHLISACGIRNYTVTYRMLPGSSRLSIAHFKASARGREIACLSKFVDPRSFVALQKIVA